MAERGVIDCAWIPHEDDSLMADLWLIQDPDALETAYRIADRTQNHRHAEDKWYDIFIEDTVVLLNRTHTK